MNRLSRILRTLALASALIGVCAADVAAAADSDSRAAREREMLHRAQEALRQSQTENAELAAHKQEAEQKLKAAGDELQTAKRAATSTQKSLQSRLRAAADAQDDLTKKLAAVTQQMEALNAKQRATAATLDERNAQLKQTQQDLEKAQTAGTSCEAKNLKLYEYSQELVTRYEKKGVWAALAQKEPVLGLKEVGMENTVQEYREKLAAQKAARPPDAASSTTGSTPK